MSSMVKAIDTDRANPSIRIEKKRRAGKKTKIDAFRRMSNFVRERAYFGGIGGIKEKYDDAEACAVIR